VGLNENKEVTMANVKLGTKAVGSIVKIKVNGASKDFIVVQQGNPNTSTYDSSCNGTWLLMKDIYTTSTFGNNNSYKDSSIHTYLNGTFYNLIDSNIRAAIKQVKIPYQNGTGSGGSLATGSNGLSTKVFLLSGYEVGWTTSDNGYFPKDGVRLAYFGNSSSGNSKRIAYNGSSAAILVAALSEHRQWLLRLVRQHRWLRQQQLVLLLLWCSPRFHSSLYTRGL